MSRITERAWGFEVGRSRVADHRRTVARFICARCPAELEVAGGGNISPDWVCKSARRDGWVVDERNASLTRCPACAGKAKPTQIDEDATMIDKVEKKAAPQPIANGPREPSQAERLKIRSILDKHFDDAAGFWLDGYSDQKAGEEIGVPWSLVTRIREAAYGPIRLDPEIVALRAAVDLLGRDLKALAEREATLRGQLDALTAKRVA